MIKLQLPRLTRLLYLMFVALLLTQATAFAQTDQGRIVSMVADANGALVRGAAIVVTNERTGEERTATTTDDGTFIVPRSRLRTTQ